MSKKLEFPCVVSKVQTVARDNTVRVTLDLPEHATVIMGIIADCQRNGWILNVQLDVEEDDEKVIGQMPISLDGERL